jgi:hypothetical protein
MKCLTCGKESINPTCPACEPRPVTDSPQYGVNPARLQYRPLSHTRHRVGWKVITISLIVAVGTGLGLYSVASSVARDKMEYRWGIYSRTVTIPPGEQITHVQERIALRVYDLEVIPHDGTVIVAYGITMADRFEDIDRKDVQAALDKGLRLEAGKGRRITGQFDWGCCYWMVVNPSKDKPVVVSIQFSPM